MKMTAKNSKTPLKKDKVEEKKITVKKTISSAVKKEVSKKQSIPIVEEKPKKNPPIKKELKEETMKKNMISKKEENKKELSLDANSTLIEEPLFSIKEDLEEDVLDNTEVYDEGDIASALERGYINQALQRHKEKLAPETHPDFDGETCIDCGNDIPEVRLKMGKIRCVPCQEKLERNSRLYAR